MLFNVLDAQDDVVQLLWWAAYAVNLLALPFAMTRPAARAVVAAAVVDFVLVYFLMETWSRPSLLGAGHVIVWTALLWFLMPTVSKLPRGGTWPMLARAILVVDGLALMLSYGGVVNFLLTGTGMSYEV